MVSMATINRSKNRSFRAKNILLTFQKRKHSIKMAICMQYIQKQHKKFTLISHYILCFHQYFPKYQLQSILPFPLGLPFLPACSHVFFIKKDYDNNLCTCSICLEEKFVDQLLFLVWPYIQSMTLQSHKKTLFGPIRVTHEYSPCALSLTDEYLPLCHNYIWNIATNH